MKYLIPIFLLLACYTKSSAQYFNEVFKKDHPPTDLQKDVDLVKKKLEKEHVNLYKYIGKKQLNFKFDSLKQTITKPEKSFFFNVKLLSILTTIGDGHLNAYIDYSKLTSADTSDNKEVKAQHPVYLFDYKVIACKLYILKNNSKDPTITPGTEILSINSIPASEVISRLSACIPSDGYNKTFKEFILNAGSFPSLFTGVFYNIDTLKLQLKTKDIIRNVKVVPYMGPTLTTYSTPKPPPNAEWKLLTADSSIAYLKVRSFENDLISSDKGFHEIFNNINKSKAKILILDLRGNTGGSIAWSGSLLTYFIDEPIRFFKRSESLTDGYLLRGLNKIRDRQIDWFKSYNAFSIITPAAENFKGKVYVLINGGCFSATSLFLANLKQLKKATFVGEETGGSSNLWTAGIMQKIDLPTSKLTLTYGILPLEFGDPTDQLGHGIMPDVPITYTIEDYLAKKDLELDWVLKDIVK